LKDVVALIATALWFALNIALWMMVSSALGLFACSVVLGILFFSGFFGYLSYRDRHKSSRSDKRGILAFAIFLCWPTCAAAAAADLTGTASVIDGDTVEVQGKRIDLFGIDAMEAAQTCTIGGRPYHCGQKAAAALSEFIGQRKVICEQREIDKYGRIVAMCRVDGEDMGAWMVAHGWALAHDRYSRVYDDEELSARRNKRGIWRGTFVRPWVWRERGANVEAAMTDELERIPVMLQCIRHERRS
jgi:endonuclease YncB( thermonuclease family)